MIEASQRLNEAWAVLLWTFMHEIGCMRLANWWNRNHGGRFGLWFAPEKSDLYRYVKRANLRKLADYLVQPNLRARFDMAQYCMLSDKTVPLRPSQYTHCGTAGCAAGHGPDAGVPKPVGEGWQDYTFRNFVNNDYEWAWMFSAFWSRTDNTPAGAAARIRFFLRWGIPEEFKRRVDDHGFAVYEDSLTKWTYSTEFYDDQIFGYIA